MAQLTYYVAPWDREEPVPDPEPRPSDPHEIRHGYNLADLEMLARVAVSRSRTRGGDYQGRYESAWFAIAEALCAADEAPERADLIAAGWAAVAAYARTEAHHDGVDPETWGRLRGFERYWAPRTAPSPERQVVEREALWQIWPQLTARQREALSTLAAVEDYEQAADAMGIAIGTFRVTVSKARRLFLQWWHEGEQPSRPWRTDRHLYSRDGMWRGKRRITVSDLEVIRERQHAGETLAAIGVDYGASKATVSALLTGRTKPASDGEST